MRRLVALLTVVLAGCCSECDRPPPERARPGDVVRELRDAVERKQWDLARLCLVEGIRGEAGDGAFDWPVRPEDTLLSVHVEDGDAIALIERKSGSRLEIVLEREGAEWRIVRWRSSSSDGSAPPAR